MQLDPVWAVVIAGLGGALIAGLAALGGQLVAARASLKQKRLELFFNARAESYRELMARAGEYLQHTNPTTLKAAQSASFDALIFASRDVEDAIEHLNELMLLLGAALVAREPSEAASQLRDVFVAAEKEPEEAVTDSGHRYYKAVQRLADAMRSELLEGP